MILPQFQEQPCLCSLDAALRSRAFLVSRRRCPLRGHTQSFIAVVDSGERRVGRTQAPNCRQNPRSNCTKNRALGNTGPLVRSFALVGLMKSHPADRATRRSRSKYQCTCRRSRRCTTTSPADPTPRAARPVHLQGTYIPPQPKSTRTVKLQPTKEVW